MQLSQKNILTVWLGLADLIALAYYPGPLWETLKPLIILSVPMFIIYKIWKR